ncbi:MAG: serine/threonine protein kinase [Kiritimatiellae bacterium]|nr:serine/threonine protein kinase [Kiritimatiellia bacterium]
MNSDEDPLDYGPTMLDNIAPRRAPAEDSPLDYEPTDLDAGVKPNGESEPLGRIDHYELLRKLGGGGFGVVYLARDTVGGIEVAIKTLHPLLKNDDGEMEHLRRQFALVSRLSHPNIASPLVLHSVRVATIADAEARRELRLSPGDFVMVMRYAPGVTLSNWRRQFAGGVVPFDRVAEIARQLAEALDYAHSERIVHRDVKPANVMIETLSPEEARLLGSEGRRSEGQGAGLAMAPGLSARIRARILDFGLAAEIRSSLARISAERHDTSGTRPYMSPEQWEGHVRGGSTDQYALACVAYELLSGAPPFSGVFETGDVEVMLLAVRNQRPQPVASIPKFANAALARALSKNSEDRFPSCRAFVAALTQGKAGGGERRCRARRAWLWAVAGTAVAVAIAAAVALAGGRRKPQEPVRLKASQAVLVETPKPAEPVKSREAQVGRHEAKRAVPAELPVEPPATLLAPRPDTDVKHDGLRGLENGGAGKVTPEWTEETQVETFRPTLALPVPKPLAPAPYKPTPVSPYKTP